MAKRHTITAALPYANGPVHIGHLAGVYVPADIYVRYLRAKDEDVIFICGSDEHGVPITIRAQKEGITPQQVVDKYHSLIGESFKNFGISFNTYSRTSSPTHKKTASDFFIKLHEDGKFVENYSDQFYDPVHNQFLADRYIKGTCPHCGNTEAYGDQCEKCGSSLSPDDLLDPKSALTGETPIKKSTKHWYLPLGQYEGWLKQWILQDHKEWKTNVYGQCKSWIEQGLHPRAVTRDLDWGVPVPVQGGEGKVLYVWFDAPIGYISATKDWATENNKNWEPYWKDKDTRLVHFIGKDNIVFHCIIFPAMLKANGEYILPENVPANEFLNLEGNKISTSRNWAVWLHEYLEDFPDKQDVLRYTLCANLPETKDNDFTWKDFQTKNNSELVAILGNFINRALVLTQKYFDNKVPEVDKCFDLEKELDSLIEQTPIKIGESLEQYRFREALGHMMDLARAGNKYLAETEPWKVIKTDEARVKTILNYSLQIAANLTIVAAPFIPFTAEKLRKILNIDTLKWNESGRIDLLKSGHQLGESSLLFEKIEDSAIEAQIAKLENTKNMNAISSTPATTTTTVEKPTLEDISFDDFLKMDLRVATIKTAEKVKGTDKLMQLLVDLGSEERTVVSGIAQHYTAEELVGKQVCLLANLAPRKIKGIQSQGMILMAEDSDGKLKLMSPEAMVNAGSKIA